MDGDVIDVLQRYLIPVPGPKQVVAGALLLQGIPEVVACS